MTCLVESILYYYSAHLLVIEFRIIMFLLTVNISLDDVMVRCKRVRTFLNI